MSRVRAGSWRAIVALVCSALLGVAALLASETSRADPPMAPPSCALRLSVEFTPDVPDPTDPGFLSSLLGNHPGYQLYLLAKVDDTHVDLQLQGPGPEERCREVVDSMRNDGRVSSIEVS
jgi:hypothetical protein